MRVYRVLLIILVFPLFARRAPANEIPKFVPNVVDIPHTLSDEDVREVNESLQTVRDKADMLGAVLIVDRLRDDSIESLAEKAFKRWKLGSSGKNNGLLLVLAMQDRKSRFEVGYGLEGDIPDAIARRALDDVLRPYLRRGEVKNAIIKSFFYLAGQKSRDAAFAEGIGVAARPSRNSRSHSFKDLAQPRGLLVLGLYLFCLWFLRPFRQIRIRRAARRLEASYPEYKLENDKALNGGRPGFRFLTFGEKAGVGGQIFLKGFLSINPGVFIFIFAGLLLPVALGVGALCLLIGLWYVLSGAGAYRSKEAYLAHLEALRKKNQRLVAKGYMQETSPGHYEYTPAYYSSSEYRSSSSSSSSGSSSSSDGGSSGGGGSSSSW